VNAFPAGGGVAGTAAPVLLRFRDDPGPDDGGLPDSLRVAAGLDVLVVRRPPEQGQPALNGDRKSLPSLLMVTRDLTKVLNDQYPAETKTRDYLDQLATLTAVPAAS